MASLLIHHRNNFCPDTIYYCCLLPYTYLHTLKTLFYCFLCPVVFPFFLLRSGTFFLMCPLLQFHLQYYHISLLLSLSLQFPCFQLTHILHLQVPDKAFHIQDFQVFHSPISYVLSNLHPCGFPLPLSLSGLVPCTYP